MSELNSDQKATLWDETGALIKSGNIKITARPGTGKTNTITEYCIDYSSEWADEHRPYEGMAILSYTNVAKNEIESKIKQNSKGYELLRYPHYIGTFDSFVNQFILLPFASRVLDFQGRPTLIGEPFSPDKAINNTVRNPPRPISYFDKSYYSYKSSYGLDGKLFLVGGEIKRKDNGSVDVWDDPWKITIPYWLKVNGEYGARSEELDREKRRLISEGKLTQADANYFAYKILEENSDILSLITSRFKSIIVDEAQDMTEVQHAILDLLSSEKSNTDSCIIIGDDAQAIYEWNTARPDLFVNKPRFISKSLTDTYRCSQNICDVLNRLESNFPLVPIGKNLNYHDSVEYKDWNVDETDQTKQIIGDLVESISIKEAHTTQAGLRVAVLARSKNILMKIVSTYGDASTSEGFTSDIKFNHRATKEFLRTIHFLQTGTVDLYRANKAYEKYQQVIGDSYSGNIREQISKDILNLTEFEEHLYRKELFSLMKDVRSAIHNKYDLSGLISNDLRVHLISLFPNVDEALEDCRNFVTNNSSVTLSQIFQEEEANNQITVKASNGKDVLINFSTIHGVKGETYDGVLYFSKAKTSTCKQYCRLNTNGKRSVKWAEIITHDVSTCESKRLVYVALSRASQTLWIAAEREVCQAFSNLATVSGE